MIFVGVARAAAHRFDTYNSVSSSASRARLSSATLRRNEVLAPSSTCSRREKTTVEGSSGGVALRRIMTVLVALKLWWRSHHTAREALPSTPLRRWESKPRAGGIIYEGRGLMVMMAAAAEEEEEGG